MAKVQSGLSVVLKKYENDLVKEWISELKGSGSGKEARISEQELFAQVKEFISLLQQATQVGDTGVECEAIGEFLESVSRSRVVQGFASDETATFIFSFKKPLFTRLRAEFGHDAELLADEVWTATKLLDRMGLLTVRAFQKSREEVINRQ